MVPLQRFGKSLWCPLVLKPCRSSILRFSVIRFPPPSICFAAMQATTIPRREVLVFGTGGECRRF
jgi:hypothetical protein